MAIKVELLSAKDRNPEQFPTIRKWVGPGADSYRLIVLFLNQNEGIALSDNNLERIGKISEDWVDPYSSDWAPCTITLSSED